MFFYQPRFKHCAVLYILRVPVWRNIAVALYEQEQDFDEFDDGSWQLVWVQEMAVKIGRLYLLGISVLLMIESYSCVKDVRPKYILRTQTPEPVFFRVIESRFCTLFLWNTVKQVSNSSYFIASYRTILFLLLNGIFIQNVFVGLNLLWMLTALSN